jgi:hypothetical protein
MKMEWKLKYAQTTIPPDHLHAAYQVHEYVSDHQHALVVVHPGVIQRLQEAVVIGLRHLHGHALQVVVHDLLQAVVQLVGVFVQHKVVRIAIGEIKRANHNKIKNEQTKKYERTIEQTV